MGLRFCSIGSGSEGNALVVEVNQTRVMLDCGFGFAETERRLARAGLAGRDINAIVVTHEHSDHIGGVERFARRNGIPVWMTHGTAAAGGASWLVQVTEVDPHSAFQVGDIAITPYLVPHDAREPVQYVFSDGAVRLGVLTDTGTITAHIQDCLSGCDALVLETNHDLDRLMNGPYPISLKRRVAGRFGHLDNATAASLLRDIDCRKLQHLVAAHLSKQNNTPSLAREALAAPLGCAPEWVGVATQSDGFAWRSIS